MKGEEIMAVDVNTVSEVAVETTKWLDETALYYTYSTIAQTLAGAFGILGAFTLFKLQSIQQSCLGICRMFMDRHKRHGATLGELELSYKHENWEMFYTELNRYKGVDMKILLNNYAVVTGEVLLTLNLLKQNIDNKKMIIKKIKCSATITALTIALSLIVLPFSTKISQYETITMFLIFLTIILSILCIFSYKGLIITALIIKKEGQTVNELMKEVNKAEDKKDSKPKDEQNNK